MKNAVTYKSREHSLLFHKFKIRRSTHPIINISYSLPTVSLYGGQSYHTYITGVERGRVMETHNTTRVSVMLAGLVNIYLCVPMNWQTGCGLMYGQPFRYNMRTQPRNLILSIRLS